MLMEVWSTHTMIVAGSYATFSHNFLIYKIKIIAVHIRDTFIMKPKLRALAI